MPSNPGGSAENSPPNPSLSGADASPWDATNALIAQMAQKPPHGSSDFKALSAVAKSQAQTDEVARALALQATPIAPEILITPSERLALATQAALDKYSAASGSPSVESASRALKRVDLQLSYLSAQAKSRSSPLGAFSRIENMRADAHLASLSPAEFNLLAEAKDAMEAYHSASQSASPQRDLSAAFQSALSLMAAPDSALDVKSKLSARRETLASGLRSLFAKFGSKP